MVLESQIFRPESSFLADFAHSHRANLLARMPRPSVRRVAGPCERCVGGAGLSRLLCPADFQQGFQHLPRFTTWPVAHRKWMDFGGFLVSSVRSARTRSASAVTLTFASSCVFPYAITPGSDGMSANQRPSSSLSNSISKDSPSGCLGTVAIAESPRRLRGWWNVAEI